MSIENVKAFFKKAEEDKTLAQKLRALIAQTRGKDKEGIPKLVKIGSEAGYEFSEEEAREALRQELQELTQEQLSAIAGGNPITDTLIPLMKSIASSIIKGSCR